MFVLSKEAVRKMLSGEMSWDRPYDMDNEFYKGLYFEDQTRVNLALEKHHKAACSALEKACAKESCNLYQLGTGKLKDGWACKEYQVDFPTAPFDSRFHVVLIGDDKMNVEDTIDNLVELKQKGARFICMGCYKPYENKPEELYEDGHGGRYLEMCRCGSDLFASIDEFKKMIMKIRTD